MDKSDLLPARRISGVGPRAVGIFYCIVSALGYTGANFCLCRLAQVADPVWTLWVKETVTVVVIGPWLLWQMLQGKWPMPSRAALAVLAIVAVAVQMLGNLGMIWSLGVVGLAVTVPIVYAVSLIGGAILGWAILAERVSLRSAVAIGALIASITLLNIGAATSEAETWLRDSRLAWRAIAASCLAGLVYAVMSVCIRRTVAKAVPATLVIVIVTAMGTLTLAPLGLWRQGVEGLRAVQPQHLVLMLAAGALNLVAFLSITKALGIITVVQANVLNASQVAMAAIGGVVFFSERPSTLLVLGVALTVLGILLIERPAADSVNASQTAKASPPPLAQELTTHPAAASSDSA